MSLHSAPRLDIDDQLIRALYIRLADAARVCDIGAPPHSSSISRPIRSRNLLIITLTEFTNQLNRNGVDKSARVKRDDERINLVRGFTL